MRATTIINLTAAISIAFAVFSSVALAQLGGGVVVCTNCSTQLTSAAQLAKDAQLVTHSLNTYNQIVTAGRVLSNMQWRNAASDLSNMASVVQFGQGLAYSAANLNTQFAQTFPGLTPPAAAGGYFGAYQKWGNTALQSVQGALRGTNLSYQQLMNQQLYLAYLQRSASSSLGQMQALQTTAQVGVEQIKALQGLQSLTMADMTARSAVNAYVIQNDMQRRAIEEHLFANPQPTPRDRFGLTTWP